MADPPAVYLGIEILSTRGEARVTGPTIIYTKTDEAPELATFSFFPVIKAYAATAGVNVELRDISLAGRIIASFPDYLAPEQQMADALGELGALVDRPKPTSSSCPTSRPPTLS